MSKFSRLVTMAYESELRADHMTDEEMEAAAEDQSIHTEVATDVEMPAAEIAEGAAEIETAVDDANSLSDTAEMLEEAADEGQGVDPVAAELVNEKIQAAAEKYQLAASHRTFSRESFNTRNGRVEVTRYLATEAEEKSKSIWERIKEWFKAAWAFVKKYWNAWMTKAGRLRSKAHALNEKLKKEITMKTGDLDIDASRLGSRNVVDESQKLASFNVRKWIETIEVKPVEKDQSTWFTLPIANNIDIFDGHLGGVSLSITKIKSEQDDEFILPVLSVNDSAMKGQHGKLKALTADEARKTVRNVITGLQNLQRQERALTKAMDDLKRMSEMDALGYGRDSKSKDDHHAKLEKFSSESAARCLSVSKQSLSKVSSTALRVASVCLQAVTESIEKYGDKKYEKPKKEDDKKADAKA